MLLYATVSSERASKGQGGKKLDIQVVNEARQLIMTVSVDADINGKARVGIMYNDLNSHKPLVATLEHTKGEKKKDEYRYCGACEPIKGHTNACSLKVK